MKKHNLSLLLVLISFWVSAQETIINSNFAIRDFLVKGDSIFFIEKRDISYFNTKKENTSLNKYFIGGYGLKIFKNSATNEIISVSNEFERTVSSLRFYNQRSKKVEHVFYYQKGKSINALLNKEQQYVVMSMNNHRIIVVDYSKKPTFKITHNITLNSLARGLFLKDNNLYYATDSGNVFSYNFITKTSKLLFSYKEPITDLKLYKENIIFTSLNGEIVKYNPVKKRKLKLDVSTGNFVLTSLIVKDKLILGTFTGLVLVVSLEEMKIIKKLNYHKRSVLKIVQGKENEFYSSSIDKSLKKWELK